MDGDMSERGAVSQLGRRRHRADRRDLTERALRGTGLGDAQDPPRRLTFNESTFGGIT